MNMRGW